jgi:pimeloyl-ACP methyl ester carboxylesterase
VTSFVLVHGAWGGAHTWRTVRPLLWRAGHDVFTPALTGIGERAHHASAGIGLNTHVHDVVQQIVYEDLTDIVLLGFSYGGMVVTGTLEHIADRVGDLVYLDAFVPADGEAVVDITGGAALPTTGLDVDWTVPPRDREFEDPDEAAFAAPRRTAQPARTFTEPVRLERPLESYDFSRMYIKATGDPRSDTGPDAFWDAADRYRDQPAWRYEEIDSNHMIPQNRPAELAETLLSLA